MKCQGNAKISKHWNEDTNSDSHSKVNNKNPFDHNKHAEPIVLSTIHTKISYAEIRLKVLNH